MRGQEEAMASIRFDDQAAQAELFTYLRANAGIDVSPGIEKRRDSRSLPLSFAQERLWFLDQLQPGNAAHNICRAQRLRGPLDVASLTRALNEVVRRHEALRTCFRRDDERPVQVTSESLLLTIAVLDLTAIDKVSCAAEVSRLVCETARRPFNLATGPLLRMNLVKCAPTDHVLVLTVQQMVFDGWSIGVFFRELASIYEAEISGKSAPLPSLPVQYADYALWQRERLQGKALQSQLIFWKSWLGGVLPILSLPTTHARPPIQSHRGARRSLSIGQATLKGLLDIGRRADATLFETLMAVFNALLYRYSGQSDIVVGFPVTNRERAELYNLIGFFVNTLALRTDLSGTLTFAELLVRVRAACREAQRHQELPFEKLVEELRVERDLSRNPIFQVMFAYQNEAPPLLRLPGVTSAPMDTGAGTAKFDLTLSLMRRQDELIGFFEYDSELFDAASIERMAGHWQILLDGIVADPNQLLSKLPMLTDDERQQLLVQWNSTATNSSEELCIHELFEAQVERTPDANAVEFDGAYLTYRELNSRANQLARYLQSLGVGPDVLVGICVERNLEMLVGLLGILKAGGAYVPLDPAYPSERISFMLRDARVALLLTQQKIIHGFRLSATGGQHSTANFRIVCLDSDGSEIAQEVTENPASGVRPQNLAYVIYTSGSTGQPKGVAIEHRNAVALLHWAKSIFSSADLAGVFASTSICFDLSVFEIFVPLSCGGTVIVAESALQLHYCVAKERVTLVNTVPSAMRELIVANGLPPAVRIVNLAGEPLSMELVRQIYQSGKVEKVYDLYGPSETTTYSTFTLRTPDARATIGRPIANSKIYILDSSLQPVPVGVQGEIFIGGLGVARGYLNRPDLTREKFLPNPFVDDEGAPMYRTGDVARYLPDGNIEYLGRADNQVKIRGYRIELGEIEATLDRHPLVSQSIVVARDVTSEQPELSSNPNSEFQNSKLEKRLVAYLVSDGRVMPPVGELRSFLREKLPEFMLPEIFVSVEELPLTPNGKVDRNALPAANGERPQLPGDFVAPRTEIEELIMQAWRDALKVEQIGVHDNFFELGGHSLLATRVMAHLQANFDIDLPLRKLFELPTVAALAGHIDWLRRNRSGVTTPSIIVAASRHKAPLSFAQRRLWFLHELDPDLTAYNIPAAYHVCGPLNVVALENALNAVVRRHESLRTAIVEVDGEPIQQISSTADLSLPVVDLTQLTSERAQKEIERVLNQDAHTAYDLQNASLMRARLLWLGDEDHVLILNFHHVIADGSSLVVFFQDLASVYKSFIANGSVPLSPLSAQYADFAAWQQEWLQDPAATAQLTYWKRQLAPTLRHLDLPTDFERPAVQSFRGARLTRRLSAELTDALKTLGRRQGVTLFMTLLAALKVLFARLSGRDDVVVGTTIAGRSRPELDGVIGFFINALALRTDLSGNPTFVELLQRVRGVCLDAYTHQDMPFERIVEEINPQRDPGRNPIFQVLFNMADVGERNLKLAGCVTSKISQTMPGAKFDLVIQAPQIDGCLELTMVYNADLFLGTRIAALLEQLGFLLQQIAANPSNAINNYSLLAPEAKKLLPDPTETLDRTWHGAIYAFVSRHAERQPDVAAVVDGQQSWSYGELDLLSSRLANYFVAGGIKPKDVVAIYPHRDATLALALLAVLKAGAVFVLLDPTYPPPRLVEYLRIARPKALLQMERAGQMPEDLRSSLDAWKIRADVNLPYAKDNIARLLAGCSDLAPEAPVSADDPAYIAFTSGSTGQPKGVLCRHGPITHFLPWQEETFDLKSTDRYSLLSGLAYNHLHRDVFTALASGATLHVPSSDCLKEPEQLRDWLREQEITILHMTPALGRMLRGCAGKVLPAVRRIFFGGDLLTRGDVSAIHGLAPNAQVVGFYGATETQRAVGYFALHDEMITAKENARSSIPTGRGARDVQLLLLTPGGQLAGIGELGELCVRSPHLATGYLDDDALTASAFVVNPLTAQADDRLYRTGDLGRYLPDGNVEWIGRKDRVVSIRGFRIELSEVKSALGQYPGVRNSAVVSREFVTGDAPAASKDERLIAYVENEPNAALDVDELRRFLSARLPNYMVPSHFQLMDRLPVSPNGKVDYSSLPAPNRLFRSAAPQFEAPRNQLEQALGDVFASLLGLERVSRIDNFFDLGGHSLLAAQAAARIRESLHVRLDVRAFLESPTVEALAKFISALQKDVGPATVAAGDEREEIEI